MSAFDQAFGFVIGSEGGYTNNPADPGGETKFGISKRAYPHKDIAALTVDQAKAIYWTDYWLRATCDRYPPPLALLVFDAAVNNGVGQAVKWLQAALGATPDGVAGPATFAALQKADLAALCGEYMAQRTVFMASLPTWHTFGLGWARRLCRLPYEAGRMAA